MHGAGPRASARVVPALDTAPGEPDQEESAGISRSAHVLVVPVLAPDLKEIGGGAEMTCARTTEIRAARPASSAWIKP